MNINDPIDTELNSGEGQVHRAIITFVALLFFTLVASGCSNYYVKIIDQYGEPVPDVEMVIGVASGFAWGGGRIRYLKSDDDGRFTLDDKFNAIHFINKNGHEFGWGEGFGSYDITGRRNKVYRETGVKQENSYRDPYYILAWKREPPEPLLDGSGETEITPSGKFIPIEFRQGGPYRPESNSISIKYKDGVESPEKSEAILLMRFEEHGEAVHFEDWPPKDMRPWTLTLFVPEGGLIETENVIRNLAPESGYQQQWTINADELRRIDDWIPKTFYLKAKNGEVYGQFTLKLDARELRLSIEPYWFNLNGSRNLTRPKKFAYCQGRKDLVPINGYRCSIDDYAP